MSERWHEHLNHLSWWEQLDRFWNPSKYSCTIPVVSDGVYHIIVVGFIVTVCVGVCLLFWLGRKK